MGAGRPVSEMVQTVPTGMLAFTWLVSPASTPTVPVVPAQSQVKVNTPLTNAVPGSPPWTLLVTEKVPVMRTTSLLTGMVPLGAAAVRVTGTPTLFAPHAYEGSPGFGPGVGSFSVTEQMEVSRIWSAPPVRVAVP